MDTHCRDKLGEYLEKLNVPASVPGQVMNSCSGMEISPGRGGRIRERFAGSRGNDKQASETPSGYPAFGLQCPGSRWGTCGATEWGFGYHRNWEDRAQDVKNDPTRCFGILPLFACSS